MVGLIVLAVAAIYIGGWVFVVKLLKQRWLKITAIVIALAIPLGDVVYGFARYSAYCAMDGGVIKLRDFEATKNVYFPRPLSTRPEDYLANGLETVEYGNLDGTVVRLRKTSLGVEKTQTSKPTSTVRVRLTHSERLPGDISRRDLLAENNVSGEVLVRARSYTWGGGWIRSQLPLGPAARCHGLSTQEVVLAVSGKASR